MAALVDGTMEIDTYDAYDEARAYQGSLRAPETAIEHAGSSDNWTQGGLTLLCAI